MMVAVVTRRTVTVTMSRKKRLAHRGADLDGCAMDVARKERNKAANLKFMLAGGAAGHVVQHPPFPSLAKFRPEGRAVVAPKGQVFNIMAPTVKQEPRYSASSAEMLKCSELQSEADGPFHGIDDWTVLRFLRGSKGKLKIARKRFKAYLEWRAAECVDAVMHESLPADVELEAQLTAMYCPRILEGLDKKGRPVVYSNMGCVDFSWCHRNGLDTRLLARRHVRELERILLAVNAAPRPELGHLFLLDIGGLSLSRFLRGWSLWMEEARIGQEYYPELMGTVCILRGPASASWGLQQVKRFLDPDSAAKFELHSGDPLPHVREHLDEALIPRELHHALSEAHGKPYQPTPVTASGEANAATTTTEVDVEGKV